MATPAKMVRAANAKIVNILGAGLWSYIPLVALYDACEQAGFALDPDETQCLICGRDSQAKWKLFRNGKHDRFLCLSWYRFDSGRYELVAYVS